MAPDARRVLPGGPNELERPCRQLGQQLRDHFAGHRRVIGLGVTIRGLKISGSARTPEAMEALISGCADPAIGEKQRRSCAGVAAASLPGCPRQLQQQEFQRTPSAEIVDAGFDYKFPGPKEEVV